jgi:hypothetical protein
MHRSPSVPRGSRTGQSAALLGKYHHMHRTLGEHCVRPAPAFSSRLAFAFLACVVTTARQEHLSSFVEPKGRKGVNRFEGEPDHTENQHRFKFIIRRQPANHIVEQAPARLLPSKATNCDPLSQHIALSTLAKHYGARHRLVSGQLR